MNILMVSSETVPFSKSGGLADVIGALSAALARRGENVRVLMPMYSFIDRKGFTKGPDLSFPMLGGEVTVQTLERNLDGVVYVGICHEYFTGRKGIYGDTSFTPYADNAERYMLFSLAVIPYIEESGFKADVIHCHDWTSGLVPYFVKLSEFRAKTVFTIHNLAYQGEFSRFDAILGGFPLDEKLFYGSRLNERFNMLKSGLIYADRITTVSRKYAEEICTAEQGCGLDHLLSARKKDLAGIINGIDYDEWNPMKDIYFTEHFSAEDLSGKAKLKAEVQKEYGLSVEADTPLFAMISRLAEQKGFGELLSGSPCALEQLLQSEKLQFIIIGTGDRKYEEKLQSLSLAYSNLEVRIVFSNEVAHRVEGGSDFFLMPSKYEPCGLNQLYSLHYGTLPIARRTGGLADSIIDLDEDVERGTGFLFDLMNPNEIMTTVRRALSFYRKGRKGMQEAMKRGMTTDFTWDKSANSYIGLYDSLIQGGETK